MTNILAMPLVELTIESSNNEDWIDSIVYLVDTGDPVPPELDIRGIIFEMEIRRSATEHEVVLVASTANGTLLVGTPPEVGHLLFNIPVTHVGALSANVYVGDIVARDSYYTRQIARIALTIVEGITKQPVVTASS
jgi:hypothetical protein